jgi:hypothetical protein
MNPYAIAAASKIIESNLIGFLAKKELSAGINVNSKPSKPSAISTELLFRLLEFPV